MKTLELSNYGVVEMTEFEKLNIDGGKTPWWCYVLGGLIIIAAFLL